jgi:hypothetical protein
VDLLVISLPKSGRTWLRVMLDDVGLKAGFNRDGFDHARSTASRSCPMKIGTTRRRQPSWFPPEEILMHLTDAHIAPVVALIAGILILIVPRLLNYVVAIYLIVVGLMGLNAIHHFVH